MIASLTRSPGTAALVAAAGWLVLLVSALIMTGDIADTWHIAYILSTVVGVIAGIATIVALNGLLTAVDGGGDAWKRPAVVLAILGVGLLALLFWAVPFWSAALSAAAVITVRRMRAAAADLRIGSWALVAAWPVGFGLFVLLDAIQLGQVDEWGDYPWAGGIGTAAWCALFAVGLAVYGQWLRARETTAAPMVPPTAA